jgi:hypothetical protein
VAKNTPKYTETEVAAALEQAGGFYYLAARILKCHAKTIEVYARRYPKLKEMVMQRRGERHDSIEGVLYTKAAAGEPWAVCFYLKTQCKDRGYTERQELTGEDGKPLRFIVEVPPRSESAEEWMKQYQPDLNGLQESPE